MLNFKSTLDGFVRAHVRKAGGPRHFHQQRVLIACAIATAVIAAAMPCTAQPYDLGAIDEMLDARLPALDGDVAVLVTQGGQEIYRYEAGDLDVDSVVPIASATKWVSGAVILSLIDDRSLGLDDRLGDHLPLFEEHGKGDITVRHAWNMRHGLFGPEHYQRDPTLTLLESTDRIGEYSNSVFAPGTQLGYDGKGMQATGQVAVEVSGANDWHDLAGARVLEPCGMTATAYDTYPVNPAVPSGISTSATDTVRFLQMVLDGGVCDGAQVLSRASIERMFTDSTQRPRRRVYYSPWPESHALYRYDVPPSYGFGAWILARHPATRVVEEVSSPGARGTYTWADRRRGLAGALVTLGVAGSQASLEPALQLFRMLRRELDYRQVRGLLARPAAIGGSRLRWQSLAGASAYRVYRHSSPILTVHDLADASLIGIHRPHAVRRFVPAGSYYAVVAVLDDGHVNLALTPGRNTMLTRAPGT